MVADLLETVQPAKVNEIEAVTYVTMKDQMSWGLILELQGHLESYLKRRTALPLDPVRRLWVGLYGKPKGYMS